VIKNVEGLETELQPEALCDRSGLHGAQIEANVQAEVRWPKLVYAVWR